nr:aromatic ring-hydroxylating dioxygenase subunit alpha [Streptomyces chartreusis]
MTSTGLPDSLIATLPGTSYTDPGIFAQEQERIFETMWFCVARASELAKPGAFRTVDVGRESILVARARDNGIRAWFNVCRHRGARICTEESGEVKRAFQCPYHAWTYDLNGKLVAAPNLTKMPDVGRTEYGLVSVAVREWLGYVWVCLAENPPSFEEDVIGEVVSRLGDVESIDRYGIDNLQVGRRITYDVRANWKLIIENFMECYHCATIHPELTEVLPEFADGYAAQYYVGHGAEFGEDVQGFTVDGSEGLDRIPGVAEEQDRRYYAITVKPQVFINLVPDHVIFHRMYPMAVDRTIVRGLGGGSRTRLPPPSPRRALPARTGPHRLRGTRYETQRAARTPLRELDEGARLSRHRHAVRCGRAPRLGRGDGPPYPGPRLQSPDDRRHPLRPDPGRGHRAGASA